MAHSGRPGLATPTERTPSARRAHADGVLLNDDRPPGVSPERPVVTTSGHEAVVRPAPRIPVSPYRFAAPLP